MIRNNLKERTFKFSVDVIHFCQSIGYNPITNILVKQLIRAATSIGANYQEATAAYSRSDFASKLSISRKEAFEVEYWLHLMKETKQVNENSGINELIKEANELKLIFSKSSLTLSNKSNLS